MWLLIDLGNTSIKWGRLIAGALHGTASTRHRGVGLQVVLERNWRSLERPERILAANVSGPGAALELARWTERRWGIEVSFVSTRAAACGVSNGYRRPERLGVDRWLALIAAHARHPSGSCVVDCGTAITIDALGEGGRHLGGLIAPGLQMMRRALIEGTAGIDVLPAEPEGILARDTPEAVAGGTLLAAVALVERVLRTLRGRLGAGLPLLLTGGDAERLHPLLEVEAELHADLVLRGLALEATEPR